MRTMRRIALGMLVAMTATLVRAEGPTSEAYGVVLNLSGKQRMLTQKMTKEILLIALGIASDNNMANLRATSELFDRTLNGLRDGDQGLRLPPTSSKRILRQLRKVAEIWNDYRLVVDKILATGSVSKTQVALVAEKNLPLLKNMNKCVKLYEKDASSSGLKADPGLAVTINLSGKQRMLTQKMSKEFLLIAYGHDVDGNKLNLLETYTLFERTLNGLRDGDATLDLPGTQNPAIREQLDVVQNLWESFKPHVVTGANMKTAAIARSQVEALAGANLPLLKAMNKAVGMYEKEAAK